MELSHEQLPEMGMRVSPRLVAASQILEMSSLELQQLVAAELEENPALELVEAPRCPKCGEALEGLICPRCQPAPPPSPGASHTGEASEEEPDLSGPLEGREDDFDPVNAVPAEITLAEVLLEELETILPEEEHFIAEYLVGSLDDRGYLQVTAEEAADYLGVPVERVKAVLKHLQALDPPGIGAANLRESMLIQLDRLAEKGIEQPYAREIISFYLRELADHRLSLIASQIGAKYDDVQAAVSFIRQHLNPTPAQGYNGIHRRNATPVALAPDVVIRRANEHFEVEVVESRRFTLRVNPFYQKLASEMERLDQRYSEEEREHIRHYMGRARFFLTNINQRRQTIQRIASCLVEEQSEFLNKGAQHIKPLTRAALAQQLGVHESTVSRAIADKYVQLPSGEVVPFSQFFTASLGVRELIREIVAAEVHPLSDQDIVERLAERGVKVARRTVAKYRSQLNILPASLRSPHRQG